VTNSTAPDAVAGGRLQGDEVLAAIFRAAPVGVGMVIRRVLIEVNDRLCAMLGYEREDLVGQSAKMLYPSAEEYERVGRVKYDQVRAEGTGTVETRWCHRDGSEIDVLLSSAPLRADDLDQGVIFTAIDITKRMQAGRAVKASEERFRSLADNVPVGVFRAQPEAGMPLDSANPALARMLGTTIDVLTTVPDSRWMADPADRESILEQLLEAGQVEAAEVQLRRANGTLFWGSIAARAVCDAEQRLVSIDGTISDNTEARESAARLAAAIQQLQDLLDGTIRVMAAIVERRDPFTSGHQRRVARVASAIARAMDLSHDQVTAVRIAAETHDIGKIGIPAEILSRPGGLSNVERMLIQTHPQAGYEILSGIKFPWPVAEIVLQHHEKIDGTGYPNGVSGDDIRIEARILSVADFVEAIATHRPYRPALGVDRALEELQAACGSAFDPRVVAACLDLFRNQGLTLDADPR